MQISVRRSLFWMALSQGGNFVIYFGGSVVMARLLTPRDMGIYAVAAAVIGVLTMIRAFGLGSFVIREPELTRPILRSAFTINALLCVLSAAVILGVSRGAGAALGDEGVTRVLNLLAAGPLLSLFEFAPSICFERIGAFRVTALVALGKGLANNAVTIALAVHGFSYMSIAWGNLAASALSLVCFNIAGWRFVTLAPSLHDWRRIGRFGLQMLTISTAANAAVRISDLLVGRLIGLSALGLYTRASGLNAMLWDNLHLVLARILFVDFAEQRRRGMSLRQSYLRVVAMITGLLWPAFAGLGILAGPVIRTIYGQDWVGAAAPLSMLCVAGLFLVAITMNSEVYVVRDETGRQLRFEARRTLIGTSLFALGCLGGLIWAAAARIADAAVAVLMVKEDLKRLTDTTSSDYTPIYIGSAGLTAAACGPAAVLMAVNGWSSDTALGPVLAAAALGVAGWALALRRMRHPLYDEARKAIGKLPRPAAAA